MDDYGYGDDNAYSAFDDPYASDDSNDDTTSYLAGDDEIDEDVLGDFALPEEDLHGLHVVDENGEEPVEKVEDIKSLDHSDDVDQDGEE